MFSVQRRLETCAIFLRITRYIISNSVWVWVCYPIGVRKQVIAAVVMVIVGRGGGKLKFYFFFNDQPDALIILILFCYKTLHVSGNFFAHNQELDVHPGCAWKRS
jgi:hypothetical protein